MFRKLKNVVSFLKKLDHSFSYSRPSLKFTILIPLILLRPTDTFDITNPSSMQDECRI